MKINSNNYHYQPQGQLDLNNAKNFMNSTFKTHDTGLTAELSQQTGKPTMIIKHESGAIVRRIDGQQITNKMNKIDTYV